MIYTKQEVQEATLAYFDGDELATQVWTSKYALKNEKGEFLEKTPDDMHRRLAKEFARIEAKFGGPNALDEEQIFIHLKNFHGICPQGSPMYAIGNEYTKSSTSNCVILGPPEDSISGIMEKAKSIANLFAARCGVGFDLSSLRPEGAKVSNAAGTSTGAWSFADLYSYVCRIIGQNGRRGALLLAMDVHHPDIEKFITMKQDLTKATGANISVKITDDFMKAVQHDEDFELRWPCYGETPKCTRKVSAKTLWSLLTETATKTAEPGLLMWDNICNNLPSHEYPMFSTTCVNPCGEVPAENGGSCRLISITLKGFCRNVFQEDAYFDFSAFKTAVAVAQRLSDDLVELEIEKLENLIRLSGTPEERDMWELLLRSTINGRRTGLGTHGLGDTLACLGVRYDSDRALQVVDEIYASFRDCAYMTSVELAKERGAFPVFDWEKERRNLFIQRLPIHIQDAIARFGRRNISLLTMAPTGSVSILCQVSSGIEPVFRNSYIRRRKLSHNDAAARVDFVDNSGDRWQEFEVVHHNLREYFEKTGRDTIPDYFVTSDQVGWERRVELQSIIQRYIDHSISNSCNLPKGTPSSVVAKLYERAWQFGLKGITVYVDGSRSGVLITKKEEQAAFPQHDAAKRPDTLPCDIHQASIKGEKWTILVGLLDGKPYEVFGGLSNKIELPKSFEKGEITKRTRKTKHSVYELRTGPEGNQFHIKDIIDQFDNPNYGIQTRLISLGLRHGSNVEYIVSQLQKDKESDMFGFNAVLARVLKKYIPDGTKATGEKLCPDCSQALTYTDGCLCCKHCGYSKCG